MKKAKKFRRVLFQGDVGLVKVSNDPDKVPEGAIRQEAISGRLIVGHSETGHHHYIPASLPGVELFGTNDPLIGYISLRQEAPIIHDRSFDTHEQHMLDSGTWKISRQREWTPEGLRAVAD
jgi:hypothetical protein